MAEREKKKGKGIDRRTFLKYTGALSATALTASVWPPAVRSVRSAMVEGATVEERAINAAKAMKKKVDLNIMMWGQYSRGYTQKLAAEFKEKTGIGFNYIDINVFMIPQRAVAEAMAKSGKIDIFHMDATMVPTLARAGLAQPMDKWMKRGGHKIETVGMMSGHMRYHGENYALLTDGNVHVLFIRKDLFENPEEQKKFQDQVGRPLEWPKTWTEYLDLIKFFTRPEQELFGSGDLRGRKAGATFWWLMHFYSKGGFPFDDDMNPAINNEIGIAATKEYVATRPYAPREAPDWGTTQMIPFIRKGGIAAVNYWDGVISVVEHPGSPTKGKWVFGLVPGSMVDGKLKVRSISSPVAAYIINRRGQDPEAAYWICQYLTGPKNSTLVVGDPDNAFHDPWHPDHFKDQQIINAYTPGGMKGIYECLQVTCPSFLLPGFQEFNDLLDKNLADAFIGTISPEEAMKVTEKEWKSVIRRAGAKLLKEDLKTYKDAMPKIDVPA